MRNTPIIPQ